MAVDKKISELTELAAAPASDDMLLIVDTSAGDNKKISAANLVWNNPYKAKAYRGSYSDISDNTWTKVSLDNESYDTNSNFDITTNYRYDVPINGYYLVIGSTQMTGTTISAGQCAIYKNGTGIVYGTMQYGGDGASVITNVSDIIYLTAGQYLELYAYGNVASAGVRVQGGVVVTFMTVCLMSTS